MDNAAPATARTRAKALSGLLLLVVLLVGTLRADAGTAGLPSESSRSGHAVAKVGIRGIATGRLTPGRMTTVRIQLRNRTTYPVYVSRIQIRITKVVAPRATALRPCTTKDFRIRQIKSNVRIRVAPRRGAWVPKAKRPAIGIVNRRVNQDGCKGAVVRLKYTAYRVQRAPRR